MHIKLCSFKSHNTKDKTLESLFENKLPKPEKGKPLFTQFPTTNNNYKKKQYSTTINTKPMTDLLEI